MFEDKMIKNAFLIAVDAHMTQRYGKDQPFMSHLWDVVGIGYEYGFAEPPHDNFDSEIVAAMWLHDTLEDTFMTYAHLKERTSFRVAELVYMCTDELGRNRKERKEKTREKIKGNEDALVVKLCDRIANIEQTMISGNFWGMYLKEHSDFVRQLFSSEHLKCRKLWQRLDKIMQKGCH